MTELSVNNGLDSQNIDVPIDQQVSLPLYETGTADESWESSLPSDSTDAEIFKIQRGDSFRYSEDRKSWYVYDASTGLWMPDRNNKNLLRCAKDVATPWLNFGRTLADRERQNKAHAHAIRLGERAGRTNLEWTLRHDPNMQISVEILDQDDHIVGAPNGHINLDTGELLTTNQRSRYVTKWVTVPYNPDAKSERLDEFLKLFIPDPTDQRILFGLLGLALRGGNSVRIFIFFIGRSTTGKSQLIAAVDNLFGSYAAPVNANLFRASKDERPRVDLYEVSDKRLIYAVETGKKSGDLHGNFIKLITGVDRVPVRLNHQNEILYFTPNFTPLIIANEMPNIPDADVALWKRVTIFPFEHDLKSLGIEEDSSIRGQFVNDEQTLMALLARIVAGARDPWFYPVFHDELFPQKYRDAKGQAFDELDAVGEFLRESIADGQLVFEDVAGYESLTTKTLYDKFKNKEFTKRDFNQRVRSFTGASFVLLDREDSRSRKTERWLGWKWYDFPEFRDGRF